ncbi:MAG: carbohydrate ABC transporter permease [Halanaerobiales bacterium]
MKNKTTKLRFLQKTIIFILLIILAILVLYPMYWVIISSLKTNNEFLSSPLSFPTKLKFDNYINAWQQGFQIYFLNSVLINIVSVVLTVSVGAACAYGLARFKFKGRNIIFYSILAGLLLSPQVAVLPLYKLLVKLNLYNTYFALILPYVSFRLPFAIFLMRSYFISIPREIEESAYIDGCNSFTTFIKIVLPISKPIIASAAIVTSRFFWNEFLFALIFIEDSSKYTIPIGLSHFRSALETNYTGMLAGITIAALPMVILFLIMQKQFIKGLTAGSVKG